MNSHSRSLSAPWSKKYRSGEIGGVGRAGGREREDGDHWLGRWDTLVYITLEAI